MIPLSRLPPGTEFLQPDLNIRGLLVKVNDCRAVVRIDRPAKSVKFQNDDGSVREFIAQQSRDESWGPTVLVVPLNVNPRFECEAIMAKKATKAAKKSSPKAKPAKAAAKPAKVKEPKATAAKKARQPKAAPEASANGEAKPRKLSQLDAAAQVLKAAKRPMNCNEMVQAMAEAGLWTSPGGKTPSATLYAAIGREIAKKGGESRFIKSDKGTFALS